MWITNVHKIYHCKVYGYTYIGYIEIGTGAIHLSFFFLEISDGEWRREKYVLILRVVYNLCL